MLKGWLAVGFLVGCSCRDGLETVDDGDAVVGGVAYGVYFWRDPGQASLL